MQRHQPTASSRIRLGTIIVGVALSLMTFGMSPAQATADIPGKASSSTQVHRPAAKAKIVHRTTVAKWVTYTAKAPQWAKVRIKDRPGTTQSLSTDWSWWSPGPGWTVRFNRTETNKMAFAFGACTTIVGPFLPAPWAVALYGGCAAVAIWAGWAAVNSKCLSAFVPVTGWPASFSSRSC